jgi:hypothetical protein
LYLPLEINPTFGSGGGEFGGRGGGRIILTSFESVVLYGTGQLLAEGVSSSTLSYGAGSGGAIVVLSTEFVNFGVLSVNGGENNEFGLGGGGGRISILVLSFVYFFLISFV